MNILQTKANELLQSIRDLKEEIIAYNQLEPIHIDYTSNIPDELTPFINSFHEAINVQHSKEEAQKVLQDYNSFMEALGAADTKGDMDFDTHGYINKYYDLYTIFRDSKYNSYEL